jgi:UDP-glucuronate 4-epimerase
VDNLNDYYDVALKKARLDELHPGLGVAASDSRQIHSKECGSLKFIKGDIVDPGLYAELDGARFDAVCHLAAQAGVRYSIENPQQYISSNIQGTFNILEYCRRNPVRRLVYASSSSVYGRNVKIPYSESDVTDSPVSLYAATKKSNELMACSYSELYGIEAVGLRFFTVYGPWGRPDMAPFLFTDAILSGRPIEVFNGGRMSRDFTYLDDIVDGVVRVLTAEPARAGGVAAATTAAVAGSSVYTDGNAACAGSAASAPGSHRVYNIGNSSPVALGDFISAIERISGRKAEKIYLEMQKGDVTDTWADTTRLREDYGYAPSTPIETGLTEFIEWFKDYYGK